MIAISHSQAEAFLQCEMKYKFAHIDKLEPKQRSQALNIGIAGHAFFEAFFKEIQKGEPTNVATMAGQLACIALPQGMLALPLVTKWVEAKWSSLENVWEILVVEETGRLNLKDIAQFPFTMDLIVKNRFTEEVTLVDHKFLGQFYSEEVMELMPQMPKYIAGIEATRDIKIDSAVYNMITTRSNAKEESLFKSYPMKISGNRKNEAMREQVAASVEINKLENFERLPLRTINKMNCGHCPYKVLCKAQIEGNDSDYEVAKELLFQPNTYGYEVKEEAQNVS